MKHKYLAWFCLLTMSHIAGADEVDRQLQAMRTEKNAIYKSKGSSESYFTANCPKQFAFLQSYANQGKAVAQALLGGCYDFVDKDEEQAAMWYRKAAEQGDAAAQLNLGVMYENGSGVDQDEEQAAMWYRKAAEQGNEVAQFNLGLMYRKGLGVDEDNALAVMWYRKAAEQGNAGAQCNLGLMYSQGLGVTKDQREAVMWFQKAAMQGNANGQVNLGYAYAFGLGVEKDKAQAKFWYIKAAKQGNAIAQSNLSAIAEQERIDYYNYVNQVENSSGGSKYMEESRQDWTRRENARTFQQQYNTVNGIRPR